MACISNEFRIVLPKDGISENIGCNSDRHWRTFEA